MADTPETTKSTEEQFNEDFHVVSAFLTQARKEIPRLGSSRETSLALTKIQEAEHWLQAHRVEVEKSRAIPET